MSFGFWWTMTMIASLPRAARIMPKAKPFIIAVWACYVVYFVSLIWQMYLPLLGN